MDPDALSQILARGQWVATGVAFLAGLTFSFSPVVLAALPVSLAYVTRAREPRQALGYGVMFALGMILAHGALGAAAGGGGAGIAALVGRYWDLVLGPVLIVLGLLWLRCVRLRLPAMSVRVRRAASPWGAFALGVPFSVTACPVCTPALVAILGVAAASASVSTGTLLLLAFALGRAVPIALGASLIGLVDRIPAAGRCRRWLEAGTGVLLILSGLYLLNAYFIWMPGLAG